MQTASEASHKGRDADPGINLAGRAIDCQIVKELRPLRTVAGEPAYRAKSRTPRGVVKWAGGAPRSALDRERDGSSAARRRRGEEAGSEVNLQCARGVHS